MNTNNPIVVVLLFIGGLIGFIPLCIFGFFYTTIKHIIKLDYSFRKQFFPIFHNFALVLDSFCNTVAGEFMNDFFLKKNRRGELFPQTYKFGKSYDTISEVLGINEERLLLNKRGRIFSKFLSIILNDNHCITAINRNRKYPGVGDNIL